MWYRRLFIFLLHNYKKESFFYRKKAEYALLFCGLLLVLFCSYLLIKIQAKGFSPAMAANLLVGGGAILGSGLFIISGRLSLAITCLLGITVLQSAVMLPGEVARGFYTFVVFCLFGFTVMAVKPWQEIAAHLVFPGFMLAKSIHELHLLSLGQLSRDVFDQTIFTMLVGLALIPLVRLLLNIILRDIANTEALEKSNRDLHALARTDQLTGAGNRRRLDDRLHQEVQRCERYGGELSLIYLDLDKFKALNDTKGHSAGDDLLRDFSRTMKGSIRSSDELFRWGGDEFIVLCPGVGQGEAMALGQKVARVIHDSIAFRDLGMGLSLGVASYRQGEGSQGLLHRADQLLYRAKDLGGRHVCMDNGCDFAE